MAYITVADVTSYGGEFSWPSGITDLQKASVVAGACEQIDAVTFDHWEPVTKSLILSGTGTRSLWLNQATKLRALSITQILYRSNYSKVDDFETNGEVVDDTSYALAKGRMSIKRVYSELIRTPSHIASEWLIGTDNYRVDGTFGHASTPENIKFAAVLLSRERAQPGYSAEYVHPESEWFPDGYKYTSPISKAGSSKTALTGIPAIDLLLYPYVNRIPRMVVPTYVP